SKMQPGGARPDRRVYSLTRRGRAGLKAWLVEPIPPVELRHPLLVKLAFAAGLDSDELQIVLLRYGSFVRDQREAHAARLSDARSSSTGRSPRERTLALLGVEHALAFCDLEIGFVERALKRLRNK